MRSFQDLVYSSGDGASTNNASGDFFFSADSAPATASGNSGVFAFDRVVLQQIRMSKNARFKSKRTHAKLCRVHGLGSNSNVKESKTLLLEASSGSNAVPLLVQPDFSHDCRNINNPEIDWHLPLESFMNNCSKPSADRKRKHVDDGSDDDCSDDMDVLHDTEKRKVDTKTIVPIVGVVLLNNIEGITLDSKVVTGSEFVRKNKYKKVPRRLRFQEKHVGVNNIIVKAIEQSKTETFSTSGMKLTSTDENGSSLMNGEVVASVKLGKAGSGIAPAASGNTERSSVTSSRAARSAGLSKEDKVTLLFYVTYVYIVLCIIYYTTAGRL